MCKKDPGLVQVSGSVAVDCSVDHHLEDAALKWQFTLKLLLWTCKKDPGSCR
jgi:hypothetical protein